MKLKLKLRIGALMKERGVSEREMHERSGVSRNSIRAMMRDANTRLDVRALEKIADVLNVRPIDLFDEAEGEPGQRKPELAVA